MIKQSDYVDKIHQVQIISVIYGSHLEKYDSLGYNIVICYKNQKQLTMQYRALFIYFLTFITNKINNCSILYSLF